MRKKHLTISEKEELIDMTDKYQTPKWVLDMFPNYFDPCPIEYKEGDPDGLVIEWKERNFVNPPYSCTELWVSKAIIEAKKGKKVIMLLRMDTSTKWFRDLMEYGANFWISWDRLHFTKRAPFPSVLVILDGDIE
jgi:hypothetical protein